MVVEKKRLISFVAELARVAGRCARRGAARRGDSIAIDYTVHGQSSYRDGFMPVDSTCHLSGPTFTSSDSRLHPCEIDRTAFVYIRARPPNSKVLPYRFEPELCWIRCITDVTTIVNLTQCSVENRSTIDCSQQISSWGGRCTNKLQHHRDWVQCHPDCPVVQVHCSSDEVTELPISTQYKRTVGTAETDHQVGSSCSNARSCAINGTRAVSVTGQASDSAETPLSRASDTSAWQKVMTGRNLFSSGIMGNDDLFIDKEFRVSVQ
ncbi:hypothetical protein J6590_002450 [Homalodisca vitripennis]|nr:hypothetical protein J6590_002450 [Homalodisca vitripennis]